MNKAIVIFFIILILEISTFACTWNELSGSFKDELKLKYPDLNCQTTLVNQSKKTAQLACDNKKAISVQYENNQISFLYSTQTKYPYLSQCWSQGQYNQNCKVILNSQKCQVWDLRITE
ncbi:MAG: hypothetical protein ACK4VO_10195 [Pseudobdellovibrio sp.]